MAKVSAQCVFSRMCPARIRYDKASCLESPVAALRRQDPVHARNGNYNHALNHQICQETYCTCLSKRAPMIPQNRLSNSESVGPPKN